MGSRSKRWSSALDYQRPPALTSLPPVAPRPSRTRPSTSSYSDALIKSSQRLRERSLTPPRPPPLTDVKPTPYKCNLDYYRGMTKSVYEKEPMFRDFARNIPLSQANVYDNSNLASLKKDFHSMLYSKDPIGPPDPLKPSAGINRAYEPKSALLSSKHKAQASRPCVLPFIYVYHRGT